ncbi:DUF4238 domain-containing protein [Alcaligenes sp. NLF5-7]|uniref:DUF4238 domain-containing protein n=1 Tax=Alcaligenes sp. NLF5-7 TaxID=2918755 RepID=UPI0020C537B5|nr:DUF4238 domain-containing protein [Alcaligenes sp. NLF5-7]UTM01068.1 DUF4238 domain-containing protein [Alcaligenes sp. NLF5-7]
MSTKKKLKSERHHWWPECVSRHWAAEDGNVGWLRPNGNCIRIPPANLGVIGNGHHIKLGTAGAPSPWDESFERAFDIADSGFPRLIKWLEGLERRPILGVERKERFLSQPYTEADLRLMSECAVSLAVRSPMNREASVAVAEHYRGTIPSAERSALIGLNMRHSQRLIADSIGARGKFVAIYSQNKEFVFGDGFFHNVANAQMAPQSPKLLVPITPHISILVCRPSSYTVEPRLFTLVLDEQEVDRYNHTVQIYAKNAIYFRSQQPELHEDFRCAAHLRYAHPGNPVDTLMHSIPGVPARDTMFDHLFDQEMEKHK